jgi:hypothetical protein
MKGFVTYGFFSALLAMGGLTFTSCSDEDNPATPPVTTAKSFSKDVLPIFSANGCVGCHGTRANLRVDSVSTLLRGGLHGPAIIAGNADSSNLVRKLSATPPFGARMPLNKTPLSDSAIAVIKTWINEGALDN